MAEGTDGSRGWNWGGAEYYVVDERAELQKKAVGLLFE